MQIRRMSEKDIESVAELEQQIFSSPWRKESIEKAYLIEANIYLVAEVEGKIAGYCGLWTSFETADLCNIAVHPEHRRKGIADAILKESFGFCRQRQVEQMLLEVRKSNVSAIALYCKNGFKNIDIRKNYYKNPVEDAIIMQKIF